MMVAIAPCLDFSGGGAAVGLAGARGKLAMTSVNMSIFCRILDYMLENVMGPLKCNQGQDLGSWWRWSRM